MSPDPRVIAELRALFKAGATPSRLVRHIVAEHGTTPDTDRLVRAYFREAFGVPMFRASADLLTLPPEQLPFAGITARTVHQMVENRTEWDTEGTARSWMESLAATDVGELFTQTHPEREPGFDVVWQQLDEPTRNSLRRLISSNQLLSEQVAILSRLAEQLQQQVMDLQSAETPAAVTNPRSDAA
jgi:hypothetical protein